MEPTVKKWIRGTKQSNVNGSRAPAMRSKVTEAETVWNADVTLCTEMVESRVHLGRIVIQNLLNRNKRLLNLEELQAAIEWRYNLFGKVREY